jgi:hypothetical protein
MSMAVTLNFVLDEGLVYRSHVPHRDGDEDRTVYTGLSLDDQGDCIENRASIYGTPAELRRLATALNGAAIDAEQWAVDHPAEPLERHSGYLDDKPEDVRMFEAQEADRLDDEVAERLEG